MSDEIDMHAENAALRASNDALRAEVERLRARVLAAVDVGRKHAQELRAEVERLRAQELMRGNALGRIAILASPEKNNITDEETVAAVDALTAERDAARAEVERLRSCDCPCDCASCFRVEADRNAALRAEVERLRRLLDVIDQACGHNRPERCAESLAAEIERLTRERDEAIERGHGALANGMAATQERHDRMRAAEADRDRLAAALAKINEIRNSIIGTQTVNWSEHVYPLVAALDDAGQVGLGYPAARENAGTLIERAVRAEAEVGRLTRGRDAARAALVAAEDRGREALRAAEAERGRLAAALAEVQEAALRHAREDTDESRLGLARVLAATPAAIADAHDRKVRAKERERIVAWLRAKAEARTTRAMVAASDLHASRVLHDAADGIERGA